MVKVKFYKSENIERASNIIDKFCQCNNIQMDITLYLDYTEKDAGRYEWNKKMYVNPDNCDVHDNLFGHPEDFSVTTVIIHEFCHYLDDKYSVLEQYQNSIKNKKIKSLKISKYSKTNKTEEIAELLMIYIINPYIIKCINGNVYRWLQTIFNSHIKYKKREFIKYWKKWSNKEQKKFNKKFNIGGIDV